MNTDANIAVHLLNKTSTVDKS